LLSKDVQTTSTATPTIEQEAHCEAQLYVAVASIDVGMSLSIAINAVLANGVERELLTIGPVTQVGTSTTMLGESAGALLPSRFNIRVTHSGIGAATYWLEIDMH